jgi:PAS domain S-box-containing protein
LDEIERARKVAEGSAAEAHLKAILSSARPAICMTDKDLRIVLASDSWCARGQREGLINPGGVVGRHIYDVVPVSAGFSELHQAVLAGETRLQDRFHVVGPDGTESWMRVEWSPWRDDTGEVVGVVSVATDITEFMLAAREAERNAQRLNVALSLTDIHVWEIDYGRGELFKAGADDSFFERPLEFADVVDMNALVHPDDRPLVQAAWDKYYELGISQGVEYRINRSDGVEVWAAGIAFLIYDDKGEITRCIGALQNVTRRKQAERELWEATQAAEAANRAKSEFLANMSHEIRTPLNGVLGMAQAVIRDELSDIQRDRLQVIRKSGEALLAILNDVLDLSKIEAGKFELEEVEFDMGDVALGAHAAFTANANSKGLDFNLVVEPGAEGVYRGDPTGVRQILYNLTSNALKFTEEGEVRVHVSRMEDRIRFDVTDTGCGISPQGLARLFD